MVMMTMVLAMVMVMMRPTLHHQKAKGKGILISLSVAHEAGIALSLITQTSSTRSRCVPVQCTVLSVPKCAAPLRFYITQNPRSFVGGVDRMLGKLLLGLAGRAGSLSASSCSAS